jgi:hypothetical protein
VEALEPVEGLADTRRAIEVQPAQVLHERTHLVREVLADVRQPRADDRQLALQVGVLDPVVEAAPLERLVQVARPVGRDDHDRRLLGLDHADLGDRDLELGEELEQEGLELVVGAIELVDQQHRPGPRQRLEQRPAQEELRGVQLGRAARAQLQQLARIVPVVQRVVDVDALVALQPDERRAGRRGECLGELGLPDAGLAFEQQRAAQLQSEVDDGPKTLVDEVALLCERAEQLIH